jgi:DNA-binding CsgD family transcriptional regulator
LMFHVYFASNDPIDVRSHPIYNRGMELLEREQYLEALRAAFQEARAGAGRVVLISGEAGIGKTSLVERFAREQQRTTRVLWGVCDDLFAPRPLGPLHDIARQIGGDLLRLIESDAQRTSIFSACLNELQRNSSSTIAVFEDVHWADEATLDLIRYLGRRIQRASALLMMTYRDDELGPWHPLRTVLGDLASSSTTRRISLAPLTEQAIQMLIGDRVFDPVVLHRQTGGNPFFVTEVLAGGGSGIPSTVRDAVLARVARLSPSAHAVLEAAAVIGMHVEPWLLAEVTGAEAQAAEECLAIGVLLAQGEALAFRHELARQIILDSILPSHKIALHRMVLDALKVSPATRHDLSRLAHHAEATSDREAVLEYAPAAARQASAASAHREAAALYALALRFADDLPLAERAQLLESCASERALVEERLEALAALREAADLWHKAGNPLKQGENLAYSVKMLIGMGRNAEAEQTSRMAIRLLEALPPDRELALAYSAQAALHLFNRNHAEVIVWGELAIALLECTRDIPALVEAQLSVGAAWMFLDFGRGCTYLEKAWATARSAGLEVTIANLLTHLGAHSCELYHFHRAERYLREGIAYATERDIDFLRFIMSAWLALTLLHLGRWSEAAQVAREVLQRPGVSTISRIWALTALGRLRARQGHPEARAALDEALAAATHADNVQHLGLVRAALAEAAWLAGDPESARNYAWAAYDLAVAKQHPWITGELAFWRWRAGEQVSVPDWTARSFALHIAGDWRAAADEWERLGCPYEQARALADGDLAAQTTALTIFEKLGARPAVEELRRKMLAAGVPVPRKPRASTRENPFGLTDRQVNILGLLVEGLSNAEIAARLHISPKTVDHHVSAVLAKLDVHSREDAATVARQHPHFQK